MQFEKTVKCVLLLEKLRASHQAANAIAKSSQCCAWIIDNALDTHALGH